MAYAGTPQASFKIFQFLQHNVLQIKVVSFFGLKIAHHQKTGDVATAATQESLDLFCVEIAWASLHGPKTSKMHRRL